MKKVVSLLLLILLGGSVFAQDFNTLLNPNSGANFVPFSSTTTRKLRTLYRTSDFVIPPTNGLITTIYLASASGSGGGTWSDLQISLGQTPDTVFSGTAFASTGMSLALNAPSFTIASVSSNAYIAFPLTTPFAYDTSQNLIVEISYNERTSGNGFSVRSNTLTGRNIAISGATQSSATGTLGAAQRTLGIDVQPFVGTDLALTTITSPAAPFFPGQATPVTVNFQNVGAVTINTATFNYQLGSGAVVSETFTGSVATLQNSNFSFTTPFNMPIQGDSTLRVWVSAVNGAPDANPLNDTAEVFLCLPLSAGNYTVGAPTSDFPTITALQERLNCSGIAGAVVFQLATGTYVGPYRFGQVTGASTSNTITFTSATGLASDVKFYAPTGNNEALSFTGTQGLNLINVTFVRDVTVSASTPLLAVSATQGANLIGLAFLDSIQTVNANNLALLIEGGSNVNLQNSQFNGFGEAIRLTGTTTLPGVANTVQNLNIQNYLVNGINAAFQDGLSVSSNSVQNFRGATNTGAGILLENLTNAQINANRVGGTLPANAMRLSNMNSDGTGGINLIANNEITGATNTASGSTGITRGLWLTGAAANGRDAVALVHNSISFVPLGSNSAQTQALLYIDGASATAQPFDTLILLNNNLVEPLLDGNSPSGFAPLIFSHPALVDSMVIGYNNYFKPQENASFNLIRIQNPVSGYSTLSAWQTAYPVDSASKSVRPYFLSTSVLQPLSLALDNVALPFLSVNTDITGAPRSATPDIGAYEFVGQVLSEFVFTPLGNTTDTTNRAVLVVINDSTGLVTGNNGPRMFYQKQGQAIFQVDSTPIIVGNTFEFEINSTSLGGVQQGDTIFYYFAVLNTGGAITTLPLGGGGSSPLGSQVPPSLMSYEISRSAQGTYTVGQAGDFATLTAAAAFINSSLFTDTATFVLIDSVYGANETFPIVFTRNSTRNDSTIAIIRPDSGVVARITGNLTATTTALLLLDDANDLVLDGAWAGGNTSSLSITTTGTTAGTALVRLQGGAAQGTENIQIRNTRFEAADSEVNLQFAIFAGGGAISATSEGRHRLLRIEGNRFERIWQGVYLRGTGSQLAYGVSISNNFFGSDNLTHKLGARGIWLHNTDSVLVQGNVMRNLKSGLGVPKAGVQVSGTNNQLRIDRNDIRFVAHTSYSGISQGAYGLFVQGGNAIEITNNIIADMKVGNVGNASYDAASGIRLAGGAGHKLYYNTVHLYGIYDQPATGGASASALSVTTTGVNNLDVRNNIFSNTLSSTSTSTGVYLAAVWFAQNYSFATSTFNNNAYAVANSSQNLVARFGNFAGQLYLQTLPDFLAQSQAGNPGNDVNSIPAQGKVPAPFVSDLILSIDTTIATPYESGGVEIASLGVPNIDFNGITRPAFGGTAPDIGAFEFAGLAAGDDQAPVFSGLSATPTLNACAPASRTISLTLADSTGVQSAQLLYRVNQGAYQTAAFTLTGGTVINGIWNATLPPAAAGEAVHFFLLAADSVGNTTDTLRLGTTRDAYLAVTPLQRDTTINGGSPLPRSTTGNAGGLLISEVFYNRINIGAQTSYPTGFPTASLQVAIEISNSSRQPINLTGKQLKFEGFFEHSVNLPAITLDSGAVIVFVAGTATNQPANGIYGLANTGGASPFNSSNSVGIWLEEVATKEVVDAVSINGHTFSRLSGVGVFDFIGTVAAANRASIQRIGIGLANSVEWVTSETIFPSSIGSYNATLALDPAVYTWQLAGSSTVLASGNSISFVPSVSGVYVLTYTDSFCSVTDSFSVTIISPDLTISGFVTPATNDVVRDPVEVKVWVKNVGNAPYQGPVGVRYRVNNGMPTPAVNANVNLAGGDSTEVTLTPNWIPGPAGAYTLCALIDAVSADPNQSNDTLCVNVNSAVSVEDSRFTQLRVFPNPANERVSLSGLPAGSLIRVQNMQGQVVFSSTAAQAELLQLEISDWQSGLYQISIYSDGKTASRKLMIAR